MKKKELKARIALLERVRENVNAQNSMLKKDLSSAGQIIEGQKRTINDLTCEIAHLQADLKEQAEIIHKLDPKRSIVQGSEENTEGRV